MCSSHAVDRACKPGLITRVLCESAKGKLAASALQELQGCTASAQVKAAGQPTTLQVLAQCVQGAACAAGCKCLTAALSACRAWGPS